MRQRDTKGAYCSLLLPCMRISFPKQRRMVEQYAPKKKGKKLSLVCGALLRLGKVPLLGKEIRIQGSSFCPLYADLFP